MKRWIALAIGAALAAGCQSRSREAANDEGLRTSNPALNGTAPATEGTPPSEAGAQKFTEVGVVADASDDRLTLRRATGDEVEIDLKPDTRITRDGEQVRPTQLEEGAEVRASYLVQGEEKVAERIEVMGAGSGEQPMLPEGQGPGGPGGNMVPNETPPPSEATGHQGDPSGVRK